MTTEPPPGFEVFQRPRKAKAKTHQCEKWELLEKDDGGYYCGACGKDQAPEKTPADIWNEAVEAVAQNLESGVIHYTWNGNPRRPNNYRAAAADARTTPNPYGEGSTSRESPEWAELCQRTEKLGEAVALWQNARDAYVAKYPKDKQ